MSGAAIRSSQGGRDARERCDRGRPGPLGPSRQVNGQADSRFDEFVQGETPCCSLAPEGSRNHADPWTCRNELDKLLDGIGLDSWLEPDLLRCERPIEDLARTHVLSQEAQRQCREVCASHHSVMQSKAFAGYDDERLLGDRRQEDAVALVPRRVDETRVEVEGEDAFDDGFGGESAETAHMKQGLFSGKGHQEPSGGGRRRGDDPDAQCPRRELASCRRGVEQIALIRNDALRPDEDPCAFLSQRFELSSATHERNAQLGLELADRFRQRGLRHKAGCGRTSEVLFAGDRDEVLELRQHHGSPSLPDCSLWGDPWPPRSEGLYFLA